MKLRLYCAYGYNNRNLFYTYFYWNKTANDNLIVASLSVE